MKRLLVRIVGNMEMSEAEYKQWMHEGAVAAQLTDGGSWDVSVEVFNHEVIDILK